MFQRPTKGSLLSTTSIILIVAFLYAITGYYGLFFAIPPGYATVIWVPSGVALGAVLVWGLRVLPGVMIGSFVTNFFITTRMHMDPSLLMATVTGFLIACGASLQALAGWWLIKKWVGLQSTLIYPNDIFLFALLSGPVACLVNASWSNAALILIHSAPANYLLSFGTWWVGDSIGVLIFTPAFLILFAYPPALWRGRILPILLPLCISFIVLTSIFVLVHHSELYRIEMTLQLWLLSISGLLFCVLINIILFILYGQKVLAQLGLVENRMALKKEESKNLLILRAAGEGIFGLDLKGCITFVNPAAARMLGYNESDLIGIDIHKIIHHTSEDHNLECPLFTSLQYNKTYHSTDEKFWRQNDSFFFVEYTSSPLMDAGVTHGTVVVFNDVTQKRTLDYALKRMAHYDMLTGIPNRASFFEHLAVAVEHAERQQQNFAVCFIDLDNFKQINDSLGHSAGDEALKIIAHLLKIKLRPTEFLARIGGDEFAILIEDINSTEDVTTILARILSAMNNPITILEIEINVSMSIGVSIYSTGLTPEELVKNADIAMYHAKESGKGTYAFFDETLNQKIQRRQLVDTQIRRALIRNEFSVNYQFQVDINKNKKFGIEALLRWHNVELGDVSPAEFILIAETNGLIHQIGEWILRQACQDFKKIHTTYPDDELVLAINISIAQLENANFLKLLNDILHDTQMNPNKLVLEITETALMHTPEQIKKVMAQAKKIGVNFSLDDFGVSYSSMQYLKDLPVSLIKIDQSFIREMMENDKVSEIVNATIRLAQGIGIGTIAEGVESNEQLQLLKKMGCHYVQGYYFYKPMPVEAILKGHD